MAAVLTLTAMLPSAVGGQSSDERSKKDVEQMLDEMAEEKLKAMHDSSHSYDFFGRCLVRSDTDEFSDTTSHSLTCYELELVSAIVSADMYDMFKEYGWEVSADDFLTSSRLTVYCDGVSLEPLVRPRYHSEEQIRVRYRFDKHPHVEQNWTWDSWGEHTWAYDPKSRSELVSFLRNLMSSDRLVFEVGGGRGEISFGEKSSAAIEELVNRCDIEIH